MNFESIKKNLSDLVEFQSVSLGPNDDIVDYLNLRFSSLGFKTQKITNPANEKQSNLLCSIGPENKNGLMLSGHLDVVPVDQQVWATSPFKLVEKENKFFGRGVVDMKGFIACALEVIRKYPLSKIKNPLILLWTYDEETGCEGSRLAAPKLKSHLKYLPQKAIIGEPTDFKVIGAHKGHVTMKVEFHGQGGHSSDPKNGISAIKMLHSALSKLFLLEKKWEKEVSSLGQFTLPYVVMNVGTLQGGCAVNVIPDKSSFLLGFRPMPDSLVERLVDNIKEVIISSVREFKGDVKIKVENIAPALSNLQSSFFKDVFSENFRSLECVDYATDAGNLSKQGIDCLLFGPGNISYAHAPNECIFKSDLLRYCYELQKIFKATLL